MTEKFERAMPQAETAPSQFDWRDYIQHPEGLSSAQTAQMDVLADLLARDPAKEEFMRTVRTGKGQPALAFVNFFRAALSPEERTELLGALENAGPVAFIINRDAS